MKKLELIFLLLIIFSSSVWAATYNGTKPKDLDLTTPAEGNTKVSEFNNSDREIKTVITNLENITTVMGTYTVTGTQTGILGSSTAGFTISFPAASTLATGTITKRYMIKNINTGTITLNLNIDGVGSPTVTGSQTMCIFTDGTSWFEARVRTAAISSNSELLDELDSTFFTNATNLATGTVNLNRIPGTLSGKDADTVDGYHAGTIASRVLVLDASALVPLANIPTTLIGKDADTVDTINGVSIVQTSRTITTTSPLTIDSVSSADLSANRTIAMPLATSGQNGYISSADWSTFNNKLVTSRTLTTTSPLTIAGVASADLTADRTIAMATATASQDGFLKKEDFQSFNNKANVVAGSGITSSSSTGTTTVTNNGVLQILAGTGISITGNGTGTPTITSVGSTTSGGWLDTGTQTVATSGYVIKAQGTISVHADYGVLGLLDRDIPNNSTLDNLTQVTTRNYADLTGTSTISPTTATVTTLTATNMTVTTGTISTLYGNGSNLTGIGTTTPVANHIPMTDASGNVNFSGIIGGTTTGALKIPFGTAAQRPSPSAGMLRVLTVVGTVSTESSSATGGSITTSVALGRGTSTNNVEWYGGTNWVALGTDTVSLSGTYTVHTFNSSGNFVVASGTITVEVFVVAGGGGAGKQASGNPMGVGGGGAGGIGTNTAHAVSGTVTVVVGAGGTGATSGGANGTAGSNSSFGTITAIGGGYGAGGADVAGGSGGSGGGATGAGLGGAGTAGQGNTGGNGSNAASSYGAGGGGGRSAVGANGTSGAGGNGGNGIASAISGTTAYYAGGGGGSTYASGTDGLGGNGGGGNAGVDGANNPGSPGTANTGGGGGGGHYETAISDGGNGGSGVVIVRYLTP